MQEFRLKQAECIQLDGYLAPACVHPMKGRPPFLWAKGSTVCTARMFFLMFTQKLPSYNLPYFPCHFFPSSLKKPKSFNSSYSLVSAPLINHVIVFWNCSNFSESFLKCDVQNWLIWPSLPLNTQEAVSSIQLENGFWAPMIQIIFHVIPWTFPPFNYLP